MIRKAIARRRKPRLGRLKDPLYLKWCALEPCCITGEWPATTHHVRTYGSPKNDHIVIRLVRRLHFHQEGMDSIERLGKRKFQRKFRINLKREADRLYAAYLAENGTAPGTSLAGAACSKVPATTTRHSNDSNDQRQSTNGQLIQDKAVRDLSPMVKVAA